MRDRERGRMKRDKEKESDRKKRKEFFIQLEYKLKKMVNSSQQIIPKKNIEAFFRKNYIQSKTDEIIS